MTGLLSQGSGADDKSGAGCTSAAGVGGEGETGTG